MIDQLIDQMIGVLGSACRISRFIVVWPSFVEMAGWMHSTSTLPYICASARILCVCMCVCCPRYSCSNCVFIVSLAGVFILFYFMVVLFVQATQVREDSARRSVDDAVAILPSSLASQLNVESGDYAVRLLLPFCVPSSVRRSRALNTKFI